MSENILNDLKEIIEPYLENPDLLDDMNEESNLIEELKVDSVDLVEIVLDIEQKFDIQIEDHLIQTLKTPKDIIGLIQSKKAA